MSYFLSYVEANWNGYQIFCNFSEATHSSVYWYWESLSEEEENHENGKFLLLFNSEYSTLTQTGDIKTYKKVSF